MNNPPTKLMFYSCERGRYFDKDLLFLKIMDTVYTVRNMCDYKFEIVWPIGMEKTDSVRTKEVKGLFIRGAQEKEIPWKNFYLVFPRELTEDELNLWRMLKIGYYSTNGFLNRKT